MGGRDRNLVTLTHVCQAWREVFISQSSLWSTFRCKNMDKTLVYLERSKSSPIDLVLYGNVDMSPHNPFFRAMPHAIGRLRTLCIEGPGNLSDIMDHLSRPAPLLEVFWIHADGRIPHPVLTPTLFN